MNYFRQHSSPLFTHCKKHKCPKCNNDLVVLKKSKIVDSKSPEVEEFSSFDEGVYVIGDSKLIWDEFKCRSCGFEIKPYELKKVEKEKRKQKRKENRKKID